MTRLRVTDRATGTVLGDVDTISAVPGAPVRAMTTPLGPGRFEVVVDGWRFDLVVEDGARADLRARATRARDATGHHGPTEVRAIIPGRVASVAVAVGDAVSAGTRLLAVEAMKMENDVRSPRDGTVERVAVGPGQTVELGDVLVVIG
jgi:acetyl/propionyl-CoA carboxylase alpha subunit